MKSSEIQSVAKSFVGTPFKHQGRKPGTNGGLDCVGVVICAAKCLGVDLKDVTGYPRRPDGRLLKLISERCIKLPRFYSAVPGDVLLFNIGREPNHVGVCTDSGMVHAYNGSHVVCEVSVDHLWEKRGHSAWRMPGTIVDTSRTTSRKITNNLSIKLNLVNPVRTSRNPCENCLRRNKWRL